VVQSCRLRILTQDPTRGRPLAKVPSCPQPAYTPLPGRMFAAVNAHTTLENSWSNAVTSHANSRPLLTNPTHGPAPPVHSYSDGGVRRKKALAYLPNLQDLHWKKPLAIPRICCSFRLLSSSSQDQAWQLFRCRNVLCGSVDEWRHRVIVRFFCFTEMSAGPNAMNKVVKCTVLLFAF